ncbi:uncharacterized protein dbf4b isoform X2 [Parambassis ranga]|uniref:Uncharacterized protein dbf4b isoform X2 n=1 Tax=Parambassis ranga TaxID=210632 RepID=A0A6P7KIF3_9TELE|nr:uncharacterized protein LOC114452186 isoform X2 [Parambassis ranga]
MQLQRHSKEQGLLGKLHPKEKKLEGKTFYLDNVKKRSTALLLEGISLLGGKVESFLHKDVNFVVTGNQEGLKAEKSVVTKGEGNKTSEGTPQRQSSLCNDKQQPQTPRPVVCGSRGKALLEKAIRNNERLQGSSVLSNARSWGVEILFVDDVLLYLKRLTRESFSAKHKRPEKTCTKQGCPSVKAVALRPPYLKIEDLSRKYRPLHMQSMTFPNLWYCGRFSPFESPPTPLLEKQTEQRENTARVKKVESSIRDKSQTPLSCNPSPCRPRKKDLSYCECCQQPFSNLEEHLQSDQHRAFVMDPSNYSLLDQLVVEMVPGFNPNPSLQSEEALNRPPSPIHDVCELESLTDVEMENVIQVLKGQESCFSTHFSSLTRVQPSLCPGGPSSGVQFTIPNPAPLPADIEPLKFDTECQFSNIQPHPPSPAMPVLNVEPQAQDLAQLDTPCPLADPYSLPPVLSPQVYYSSIMDPHSPYSEPPVLSPQPHTAIDSVEGQNCEINTADSASTLLRISVAEINAKGEGSNQEGLMGFSGLECSTGGLEYTTLSPRRSRSITQLSAVSLNPKKRCRSTSSEHGSRKRRKPAMFGYTEQRHESAKPQSGCCVLFDIASPQHDTNVSLTCTMDVLPSKQTYTPHCFPAVPSFSLAPYQIDCSSKKTNFYPPLDFHNNKSHSSFSSQDTQRSLAHSTSICIDSALIPDPTTLSPSSDSDWDCDLLSRLGPSSAAPLTLTEQNFELDKELLHTPCPWMHNTSYESHLHTVLQPSPPAASLCGDEMDPSAFSRTVVQIVEVQH